MLPACEVSFHPSPSACSASDDIARREDFEKAAYKAEFTTALLSVRPQVCVTDA
jgi:hypothetical protein